MPRKVKWWVLWRPGAGQWSTIVTNPDQTQTIDAYTDGLLASETNFGTQSSGSPQISAVDYGYNGLREETSQSDYTGTTQFTYFQDGTLATQQLPGHSQQSVSTVDGNTEDTTAQSRADGTSVSSPENALGLASSQSGAGVLPENFAYDPETGNLNTLTTYQSNVLGGSGAATTTWNFDPSTGLLLNKQYADYNAGSGNLDQMQYAYDSQLQLTGITEPGVTTNGAFQYNAAGELASWSLQDSATGAVSSNLTPDEMGRPTVIADTDNGRTFTETSIYNAQDQLKNVAFSSAGGSSVGYQYYPTTSSSGNASPGALQTMTVTAPVGQQAATNYNYGPADKRLQTISVNGVAIQYTYLADSNQIGQVSAGPADANGNLPAANDNIVTTYTPDTSDPARIHIMQTQDNIDEEALYSGTYGYNQLDQITTEGIVADGVNGAITHNYVYGYSATNADAVTSVTDTNNTPVASYSYDGAGNFVNCNFATQLGTANSVNQYSNLTYNARGDVTTDVTTSGMYNLGWDAADRLISITPANPVNGGYQLNFGYDGQNRLLWKDVYTWNASAGTWNYAYSRHYVWDGSNLVEELDQNNSPVVGYTWGPTGLALVTDYTQSPPKTYQAIIDAHGSVVAYADPIAGGVSAVFQYDPYGSLVSSAGFAANLGSFRGKGLIVNSEIPTFMFAGNRVNDGRIWLSRDQSGLSDDNPYRLYGGDPVNNIDTDGLAPVPTAAQRQQTAIAMLQGKYGQQWTFTATPSGFVGVQAGSGRQMVFNAQLDQTGYYSPSGRSWQLEARVDGSLWRVGTTWNSDTKKWEASSTQLVPSYREAQNAQHTAIDDAKIPAWGLSDQLAGANAQNAAALISIRDHMLRAMRVGLEVIGATNPLVGGSEIVTGRNLDGQPMHGSDYVQAGASLVPAEIVFVIGGKALKIATGVRARTLLREALGANPYPVAAQAHHLFPVQLFNTQMGRQLAEWGINLNGAENGVWLPVYDYAGRVASIHRGAPGATYAQEVLRRLGPATSRDDALAILAKLRGDLLTGKLKINEAD